MQDDQRPASRFSDLWLLDPEVDYLNHGLSVPETGGARRSSVDTAIALNLPYTSFAPA